MRFRSLTILAIALGAGASAAALGAQARVITLPAATELLSEPGGRVVAALRAGAELSPGEARGALRAVSIGGFVDSASVRKAAHTPVATASSPM